MLLQSWVNSFIRSFIVRICHCTIGSIWCSLRLHFSPPHKNLKCRLYTLSSSDLLSLQHVMAGTALHTAAHANWAWRSVVSLFIYLLRPVSSSRGLFSYQRCSDLTMIWTVSSSGTAQWPHPDRRGLSVSLCSFTSPPYHSAFMPRITDEKSSAVIACSHHPQGSIPNDGFL